MPKTTVVSIDPAAPQPDVIRRAADCLRGGGLVAFPTETVYGLGVHALDRDAVVRLFAAKGRPANDPLIVHVPDLDAARALVAMLPDAVHALASRFWPGPLTIVLQRSARIPDEVTSGLDTVAIRVPAHPVARALISAAGVPVAAPSANRFSRPSPTRASHVLEDLEGRIDMVVDAGATLVGVESTVLDLSGTPPIVLRPGAITLDMLRGVLPDVATRGAAALQGDSASLPSPGLLAKHYAPATPLTLLRCGAERATRTLVDRATQMLQSGARVVLLAPEDDRAALEAALTHQRGWTFVPLGRRGDLELIARGLYAALREADAGGADAILLCDTFEADGLGLAIKDRLQRAAASIENV
jgi:L-threonylcarbamoyladenylate synthase